MARFEHLISRYLDGDLTPAEQNDLQQLLAESPDARALLRQMQAVAEAARRTPVLHRPNPSMEQALFQRLASEGLYGKPTVPPTAMRRMFDRISGSMVALVLLLLAFGVGGLINSDTGNSGKQAARVADGARGADASLLAAGARPLPGGTTAHAGDGDASAKRNAFAGVLNQGGQNDALVGASEGRPERTSVRVSNGATRRQLPAAVADHRSSGTDSARHVRRLAPSMAAIATNDGVARDSGVNMAPQHPSLRADLANAALAPRDSAAPLAAQPQQAPPSFGPAPAPPARFGWAASLRGGIASLDRSSAERARELDVRVGVRLPEGHQFSVVLGMGAAVRATDNVSADLVLAAPPGRIASRVRGSGSNTQDVPPGSELVPVNTVVVASEPWAGVSYNFALPVVGDLSLAPGLAGGLGGSTLRLGLELPLRYRMSSSMSIECAASVAHVFPRAATSTETVHADKNDVAPYVSTNHSVGFTSYGVQVGISLDLGGGR